MELQMPKISNNQPSSY